MTETSLLPTSAIHFHKTALYHAHGLTLAVKEAKHFYQLFGRAEAFKNKKIG